MTMTPTKRMRWEDELRPGSRVVVRWGYGFGFRARGRGVIGRIYRKSFQVQLSHDVASPTPGGIPWRRGFVVKGVPRQIAWDRWHPDFCVEPDERPPCPHEAEHGYCTADPSCFE